MRKEAAFVVAARQFDPRLFRDTRIDNVEQIVSFSHQRHGSPTILARTRDTELRLLRNGRPRGRATDKSSHRFDRYEDFSGFSYAIQPRRFYRLSVISVLHVEAPLARKRTLRIVSPSKFPLVSRTERSVKFAEKSRGW